MNRATIYGGSVLLMLLLTSCASRGDLEEHFVGNAPPGWIDISGTDAYMPPGEDPAHWTKKFRVDVFHEMQLPVTSWSTSLVDTHKESDCPDMYEVRKPITTENGFRTLVSAYYCPYSEVIQSGAVEVIKMIQGKRNRDIYSATFVILVPRFKPGERPTDFDIKPWEDMLASIMVCTGDAC